MLNKYSFTTFLVCCISLTSCAGVKPFETVNVSTDRNIVDILKIKSEKVKSIHASFGLIPAIIAGPELSAYMYYNQEGQFRLTGLTPAGFTLFNLETTGEQFILSLSDGRNITGDVKGSNMSFKDIAGIELPLEINAAKELIDFYGCDLYPGSSFLIEDIRGYYILNQLESVEGISYPVRRWWIEKQDMIVSRKEIFSGNRERIGKRSYEALYEDFRIIDGIPTPFRIIIKDGDGNKLLRVKFYNVEYNKET